MKIKSVTLDSNKIQRRKEGMKRVLCLYRVSSKRQLHGDDIPLQRTECLNYIASKKDEGWEYKGELIEKGVSAFKNDISKRDVLVDIASRAERKKFDILLVYMSDRISRKGFQGASYIEQLHNAGVEIWTVMEGKLKIDTQEDRLLLYMKLWSAEGESIKTSGRVNDAQVNRIKEGKHVGGYTPYGYDLAYTGEISNKDRALKELVINPEQAKIIVDIFHWYVYDGLGSFRIAQELNKKGIRPVKTDEWGSSTITSILRNPVYKGYLAYNRRENRKRVSEENWIYSKEQRKDLVIIPELIWDKAQKIRQSKNYNDPDKRAVCTTGSLVLMGLAYCGYCGTRLTNASRYDYWTRKDGTPCKKITGKYKCTNKANGKINCEGRFIYNQDDLEEAVFKELYSYINKIRTANIYDGLIENQKKQRIREQKELAHIEKNINAIKKDIGTLENQIPSAIRGEYIISIEKLSELIKNKESELSEVQKDYILKKQEFEKSNLETKDLEDFRNILPNWVDEFKQSTPAQKKIMLADIVERIDVYHDSLRIKLKIKYEDLFTMKNCDVVVSEPGV